MVDRIDRDIKGAGGWANKYINGSSWEKPADLHAFEKLLLQLKGQKVDPQAVRQAVESKIGDVSQALDPKQSTFWERFKWNNLQNAMKKYGFLPITVVLAIGFDWAKSKFSK